MMNLFHVTDDVSDDSESAVENAPADLEACRVSVSTDRPISWKGILREVDHLIKSKMLRRNRAHDQASVHDHPQEEPADAKTASDDLEAGTHGEDRDSEAAVENSTPDLEAGLVDHEQPSSFKFKGIFKKAFRRVKSMISRKSRASVVFSSPIDVPATSTSTSTSGGFGIRLNELVQLLKDRTLEALDQYEGVQGLSIRLKTDLKKGINGLDDEIRERKHKFGSNTYPYKKGKTFWRFIWKAIRFPPSVLITLATVIKLLLRIKRNAIHDGCYEEACILLFVVLDIIVRASTEYIQSRRFEKFTKDKRNAHLYVTRDGGSVLVSIYDIVVGDIVHLKSGGQVPADGVLFVANSLKIVEQDITAPHQIVEKDLETDPFLLSGSKLIEGIGKMLVTSVGMNTEWGKKMMEIADETDEEKPFHVYLKWTANFASYLVVLLASVACIVQLCRYFNGRTKKPDGNPMFIRGNTTADEATEFLIISLSFGIATVIVAVPVGLSIAVLLMFLVRVAKDSGNMGAHSIAIQRVAYLNLANTVRKMMSDNAMVQKLSSCERMGSVTTIMCHKTGILTLNKMSVVDVRAGEIRMQDMDYVSQLPTFLKELIIEGIAQNTNGIVVLETGVSPTEEAILRFGTELGMNFDEARSASLVYHTIPFNPNKKYGGVALKLSTQGRVHWKGSAKIILSSCKEYMDGADNHPTAIDEQKRKDFEETINNMCMRGLRCAALAYQPYELEKLPTIEELSGLPSLPGNLVLLAIIGIKDPCRPGTKEAIQLCQSAGVKVCMVTDDDVLTATAIAKECGIFGEASDGNIMKGADFRNLSGLERKERARSLLVLAQSCPSDNLLYVKAVKESGNKVAATGMGIHDSETLQAADVSIAMGVGGTAAAKEKSDIIILDDDFATIVKVIRWCRYLYTNIQKYVLFRLTVSVSVLAICVVEVVFYNAFPLNVVQLLLLNLIIDIFGAVALAYRPPAHHLMGKPPVGKRDHLITKMMWSKLVLQVIYLVLFLAVINNKLLKLMHGHTGNAEKLKNTFIFNSIVFCLVFSEFKIESLDQTFKEIVRDNMFVITFASTIILQIILIQFLGIYISAVKLDWKQWLLSILVGLLSQFASQYPIKAIYYYSN